MSVTLSQGGPGFTHRSVKYLLPQPRPEAAIVAAKARIAEAPLEKTGAVKKLKSFAPFLMVIPHKKVTIITGSLFLNGPAEGKIKDPLFPGRPERA